MVQAEGYLLSIKPIRVAPTVEQENFSTGHMGQFAR